MSLIYPALFQIFWTLVVLVLMFVRRQAALRSGEVRIKDIAVTGEAWPTPARLAAANFANQFETPVLFYALTIFASQVGAVGWIMTTLAWTYVATRVVHTLIHTGSNRVMRRAQVFALGLVALFGMLVGTVATLL